jgi:hypothetical protein
MPVTYCAVLLLPTSTATSAYLSVTANDMSSLRGDEGGDGMVGCARGHSLRGGVSGCGMACAETGAGTRSQVSTDSARHTNSLASNDDRRGAHALADDPRALQAV